MSRPGEHPAPKAFFTSDHRECDALWSSVENAINDGDEAKARSAWEKFETMMRRHFRMEEEVLFPAVEDATGMPADAGPTAVMRSEHSQMRGLLDQMAAAMRAGDLRDVLDHGDTLLMIAQQHNLKEESVLYPMCDDALGEHWGSIAGKLESY